MKNVKIELQYLISYDTLYPDQESIDVVKSLSEVPRAAAIEHVSQMLHLFNVRHKLDTKFHIDQLILWVMKTSQHDKNLFGRFVESRPEVINQHNFLFVDRLACIELIQTILVHTVPIDLELNDRDYSNLFKCLLHFNSLTNLNESKLFNWKQSDGNIDEFICMILPMQFRELEISTARNYKLQLLKVYYFFSFAEKDVKYSQLLSTFLKALNITKYPSYIWRIFSVYFSLMNAKEATCKMIISGDDNYLNFFKRMSISGNDVSTKMNQDYVSIRQSPIFNPKDNEFIFLDYRLFVDKFYLGFLFDFAVSSGISFGNLKSDMGQYFSEHILFYTVMKKCFSRYGQLKLSGEEIKAKIGSSEPDYYIREGAKVFVFEFKDITISTQVKYSGDASVIKNAIIEKLELSSKNQAKGISQLFNTINDIKNGVYKNKDVDSANLDQLMIYPILVVTDVTLEAYGVNYFLQQRLDKLLTASSLARHKIKRLTVINLDTLLELQDYFNNGKLKLPDCINSYINYTSTSDSQTASYPFDKYVKNYFFSKMKQRPTPPEDFLNIMEKFERTAPNNYE